MSLSLHCVSVILPHRRSSKQGEPVSETHTYACLQVLATARVPPGHSVTMQGVMAGRVARIGELQVTLQPSMGGLPRCASAGHEAATWQPCAQGATPKHIHL